MLVCEIYVYRADPIVIALEKKSLGFSLWQELLKHLQIRQSQYFGLQYTDFSNKKRWIDFKKPLFKQLKCGSCGDLFPVDLRVKHWPTVPYQVTDDLARCLMVAEVYELIQSGRLQCTRNSIVLIGGLTLQSQLGNYEESSAHNGYSRRFFLCRDQNAEVEAEMEAFHRSVQCRGLQPSECDRHILQLARWQSLYGVHWCIAKDIDGCHIDLGISCNGLLAFRHNVLMTTFTWFHIVKAFVEKELFFVELLSYHQRTQVGFYMESKKEAKFFLRLFVDCQRFYTDNFSVPKSLVHDRTSLRSQQPIRKEEMCHSLTLFDSMTSVTSTTSYQGMFDLKSPDSLCTSQFRVVSLRYCADLQLLNVQFKAQLVSSDILSPRQVSELFGDLSLIQAFNNNFLLELEERISLCKTCPERYNYRYQIGDILKKRMACMKLYTKYVKNESKIFELVRQWQREISEFSRLCSQFGRDKSSNRPLFELFYRPFQRMIHYRELMKRLINHIDLQNDCEDVKEALRHLEIALEYVNKSTRAAESTRKMIRIQREVLGVRNILQPHRTLIMEGTLLRVETSTVQLTHFFLFSDILLYAVEKSGLSGVQLVARCVLPLVGMKVKSVEDSEGKSCKASFTISKDTTLLTVIAETIREKDLWIASLTEAIRHCDLNIQSPVIGDGSDSRPASHDVARAVDDVKKCTSCGSKFHVFRRRRKCEQCCKMVCRSCLSALSDDISESANHVCMKCSTEANKLEVLSEIQPTTNSKESLPDKKLNLLKLSSDFVLTRSKKSREMPPWQTTVISNEIEKRKFRSSSCSNMLLSLRSASFSGDSEMSGYLFHRVRGKGGWKQYWVVVSLFTLQHYKNHDDSNPVSTLVPVVYELAYPDVNDVEAVGCMYVFKLFCGLEVLYYMTKSKFALDRWTEVLSWSVKRSLIHLQRGCLLKHPGIRRNRLTSNTVS
ncbi:FYVE, RhoGEF and PH domain-containing protein 5-like isoform X2 [Corticium candelabrum]|uniref:FYVE, RhoGEF and PH domain-containing protein 5-like isoform X2 n=1 Tax=Corticium candelabrum TaxID=121492 RepID=UPI002E25FF46|nr:FYVE, RhoGEF and PH domain-containing protein 5-like isoform X2 [Corticium candelabrum]